MASLFSWISGGPPKTRELKEAENAFTPAELKELHQHFEGVCALQPGSGRNATRRGLDGAHFASLVGLCWDCLDPLLQSRLLWLVADRTDGRVHLEGLTIAKARMERLGEEASLEFTFQLLDVHGDGALSFGALEVGVLSGLRMAGVLPHQRGTGAAGAVATAPAPAVAPAPEASSSSSPSPASTAAAPAAVQQQVAAICRGALAFAAGRDASAGSVGAGEGAASVDWSALRMSYPKYCEWTKRCPALHRTLGGLLRQVGRGSSSSSCGSCGGVSGGAGVVGAGKERVQVRAAQGVQPGTAAGSSGGGHRGALPVLVQLGKLSPDATLLRPAWAWALSSRLPAAQRSEWRLLFSSQRDGKSFNTFFSRVSAAPGPTLLLVRDKAGALFGGYASQPWAKSGSHYGDVSCFIFSLLPALQVFPATGINDNYQWCGVGFSQLPGGLGFGGAAASRSGGHFALYVEPSLDAGMSRPIATYGNSPLASEQVFQIDTLECWLVQPPEEDEEGGQPDPSGRSGASGSRNGGGGGVLSKAAEDRAIMQLAGMTLHSDGLREEPLEED